MSDKTVTMSRCFTQEDLYRDLIRRTEYIDGELIWRITPRGDRLGRPVGREDKDGYLGTKLKGKVVVVHRVIYFMFHGSTPRFLDHIDGNPRNNRIENLREVSASQNQMNARVDKSTQSGVKGVFYNARTMRYLPAIRVLGRHINLGTFYDKFEAVCARKSAEITHHSGFHRGACLGKVKELNQ